MHILNFLALNPFEIRELRPDEKGNIVLQMGNVEVLDEEQTARFIYAVNVLRGQGKNCVFSEGFTVEQAISASRQVSQIVNEINNAKINGEELTPLEKFAYAFSIVTERFYKKEDPGEDISKSRALIHVLNGDKIVCVGFASFLQAICRQIGIPCERLHVSAQSENQPGHAVCLLFLNDPAYGIKSGFISDPTSGHLHADGSKSVSGMLLSYAEGKDFFASMGLVLRDPWMERSKRDLTTLDSNLYTKSHFVDEQNGLFDYIRKTFIPDLDLVQEYISKGVKDVTPSTFEDDPKESDDQLFGKVAKEALKLVASDRYRDLIFNGIHFFPFFINMNCRVNINRLRARGYGDNTIAATIIEKLAEFKNLSDKQLAQVVDKRYIELTLDEKRKIKNTRAVDRKILDEGKVSMREQNNRDKMYVAIERAMEARGMSTTAAIAETAGLVYNCGRRTIQGMREKVKKDPQMLWGNTFAEVIQNLYIDYHAGKKDEPEMGL